MLAYMYLQRRAMHNEISTKFSYSFGHYHSYYRISLIAVSYSLSIHSTIYCVNHQQIGNSNLIYQFFVSPPTVAAIRLPLHTLSLTTIHHSVWRMSHHQHFVHLFIVTTVHKGCKYSSPKRHLRLSQELTGEAPAIKEPLLCGNGVCYNLADMSVGLAFPKSVGGLGRVG